MPAFHAPQPKAYLPVTFLERGVLVPFTTPVLAGTRARPAERHGTELMVPNLSGGRGVYVVPWAGIYRLCSPTVYDRRLNQKVEALITVTPGTIRRAARDVAMEGLAGREAQVAAVKAAEQDDRDRLQARTRLLIALLEQLQPGSTNPGLTDAPEALDSLARRVVADRGPRFGLMADTVALDLEQLADVFSAIGVLGEEQPARIPQLLESVARLHLEATAWARDHRSGFGDMAAMIAEVAAATVACAASTLRDARAVTEDIVVMLRQWSTNASAMIQLAARPEWLLDGWDQICQLWRDAEMPGTREAALAEMAMLAPVLPKETQHWVRAPVQQYSLFTYRRTVLANEDWRTGAAGTELVSRNERLRARCL